MSRTDAAASRSIFGSSTTPAVPHPEVGQSMKSDRKAQSAFSFGSNMEPGTQNAHMDSQSRSSLSPGTEAPSLFSTLPISLWNVKDTNANPCSTPKLSAANNNSSPSCFPGAAPNKQDNSNAQSTSLFSSLPKTAAFTSFAPSTVLDYPAERHHGFKTSSFSFSNISDMPKDVLTVAMSVQKRNIASIKRTKASVSPFGFSAPPITTSSSSTMGNDLVSKERQGYMSLHHTKDNKTSGADEQLRTAPLLSLSVKEVSESSISNISLMFPQYAFLGCRISDTTSFEDDDKDQDHLPESEPVLLNTNTPWSAFICGSQGSGKSYSLSAIIENCLHASPKIGKLPKPLAGVVFHNNTASAHNVCEAAHLVSLGVKVNVLVSRSNYHALSSIYKKAVSPQAVHLLNIQPLVLQSYHLTAERMHRLMAFQESETAVPLYMEVIMRILREMAITGLPFNYSTFKAHLDNEGLTPGQKVMMEMRLCLLESFMDPSCTRPSGSSSKKIDLFNTAPGTFTIVDLSDPFLDSSTTCTLFDILLSLFLSSRLEAGMLICLDEAHKFMKNTHAAETFTENLLAGSGTLKTLLFLDFLHGEQDCDGFVASINNSNEAE
ncbi:hypothetical protein D6D01_09757 [Aureobasidium pullulans]|uniref:Uncharacterized protein n=1 Tax=Aureobasidium pullulans TaxID=5580 RepID=A0A4S9JWU3_AURPU|nr:hypothetical protein D6D01_09757 [Aureobasidium pullulans]